MFITSRQRASASFWAELMSQPLSFNLFLFTILAGRATSRALSAMGTSDALVAVLFGFYHVGNRKPYDRYDYRNYNYVNQRHFYALDFLPFLMQSTARIATNATTATSPPTKPSATLPLVANAPIWLTKKAAV